MLNNLSVLENPLLNKLSNKVYDYSFLVIVTLMYVAMCAEAEIYVPAFPEMIKYFNVAENEIQLILSLNFAGLCISGIVTGPLSDAYGRRKVLLGGLLLFTITSLGCAEAENFVSMIIWRFLQGVGASTPMIVSATMIFDKYSAEKAGQTIGILNSVIFSSMASAPIIGAWVTKTLHWRVNFVIIFALAFISFVGSIFFLQETLDSTKRSKIHIYTICNDYKKLVSSFDYLVYVLISLFPLIIPVLYAANSSIIFVNHLGLSLEEYSYYQATIMVVFIIFSALGAKLISLIGMERTKNLGSIIIILGVIGLALTAKFIYNSATFICFFMSLIAAGGAMITGIFGVRGMEIFPKIKGTALAMATAIRQSLSFGLILLSQIFYDGTIRPVASIIAGYTIICVVLYALMYYRKLTR